MTNSQSPESVILQANGSLADLKSTLQLAINMHEVLNKSTFEVVVFGKNVNHLTAFSDHLPMIQKALDANIKVIACGRSMKAFKITDNDLAPGVDVVPFGAVHIAQRQYQGWQYIKY